MPFTEAVALAARVMEATGVATMVLGALLTVVFAGVAARSETRAEVCRRFRQRLGRAILLGLEFLVAADIIRTVSEIPTLERVVVLAIIVLIRTFLSFTLELEIEGRWPWQRHASQ